MDRILQQTQQKHGRNQTDSNTEMATQIHPKTKRDDYKYKITKHVDGKEKSYTNNTTRHHDFDSFSHRVDSHFLLPTKVLPAGEPTVPKYPKSS